MRLSHRFSSVIIALILLIAVAVSVADAGAFVYSGKRRKINCGIIAIPGLSQPLGSSYDLNGNLTASGGVGHLFYYLDILTQLKPAGWSLENPLSTISASQGSGKNYVDYWIIDLSKAGDLSKMNVLYLPLNGTVNLKDQDREKLRQFVDSGGLLWIDNVSATSSPLDFGNTFFIQNFKFVNDSGVDVAASRHHPLLSIPYWLDDREIGALGYTPGKWACNPGYETGVTGGGLDNPTNFDVLLPVCINNSDGKPSVAANAYGSGRIVATSNFVGKGCLAKPYLYALGDLKFAYNMLAWTASWTDLRKNPRHSGSSIDTVGGTKLVESWSIPLPATDKLETAPVVYKNVAFYSSGNTLYAMDINPQEDLDGDGSSDDGMPDALSTFDNYGQDLIWKADCDSKISAPVVASTINPAIFSKKGSTTGVDETIEAVAVTSASGKIYAFEAFPHDSTTGKLLPAPKPLFTYTMPVGTSSSATTESPRPPVYNNGWIFAMGPDARLYAYNPSKEVLGQNAEYQMPFNVGGTAAPQPSGTPKGGPNFGFVKNDTSGAIVGMVYWCTPELVTSGSTPSTQNDCVYGIPVYVCNDRLKVKSVLGTTIDCETNYKNAYLSDTPQIVVWARDLKGNTIDNTGWTVDVNVGNQPGRIQIKNAGSVTSDAIIYATYALNYSSSGSSSPFVAQPVKSVPQPSSAPGVTNGAPPVQIVGTPAMGNDNTLFFSGVRDVKYPSSIYAMRNDGSSTTECKWNYLLHSGQQISTTSGVVDVPPVILYKDPNDKNATPVAMQSPEPSSSPTASGDKVFVTVKGNGTGPKGALLCFKANPDFTISLTENSGYNSGGTAIRKPMNLINESTGTRYPVAIWQPNLLDTTGQTLPMTANWATTVPPSMIDYERGTITITNFDSLRLKSAGYSTGVFSPSLPVWVFVNGIEVPIDMSTWGPSVAAGEMGSGTSPTAMNSNSVDLSSWNNLLWYYVVPDSEISSPPVVIGSTVYFSDDDGNMYALNAETGETQGSQTSQTPIWQWSPSSRESANNLAVSAAGSNGVLLMPTADRLRAFTNATTLVSDATRIAELDGAGDLAWSADSIAWPTLAPTASMTTVPTSTTEVTNPGCVRYINSNEILLVNTGASQVCRIDKSGNVGMVRVKDTSGNDRCIRWMFDKFTDPKRLLVAGQPLELRHPNDAWLWQESEYIGSDLCTIVHCLIADSGNYRIVDLVYRFNKNGQLMMNEAPDPSTGFVRPELNWVSRTDSMDQRFTFNSIQLVDGTSIWAAASNYRTGTNTDPMNTAALGGAIVAIGYRERSSATSPWNYYGDGSGEIFARCDRVNWGGNVISIADPRFFQIVDKSDGRHLLICDNYGVYYTGEIGGNMPPTVIQALTDQYYRAVKRSINDESTGSAFVDANGNKVEVPLSVPLMATSAQILPNQNWLITNNYTGSSIDGSGKFSGEVFEYVTNGGIDTGSVSWSAPSLSCTDDPTLWHQSGNSSKLNKPRSAFRK